MTDPEHLVTPEEIEQWLDEHGRTGDPMLDGLRYAQTLAPIDVVLVEPQPK